jgi:hypothetical protein
MKTVEGRIRPRRTSVELRNAIYLYKRRSEATTVIRSAAGGPIVNRHLKMSFIKTQLESAIFLSKLYKKK